MDAPAPLEVDLVIVDEASMCDVPVAAWLLRAINPDLGTRVVWCGDVDQLPSVGHGQVLADLIESGVVPTAQLTEVFRQSADSPIVRNAHRLLDGEPLDLEATRGWRFVNAAGSVAHADQPVIAEVLDLLADGWTRDDVQVLSPMRRGDVGVEHLNRLLQDLLNPAGSEGPWVGGDTRARLGDRVIATRNIYDLETPLYNGEQGIVVEADPHGWMRVEVGDRAVTITGIHCLMMRLAWAVTVHRSQGSEYPAVVLAYDHRAHARMLDIRLLYTAITRAKQHCSIVGTSVAISETLRGRRAPSRYTTLSYHLSTLLPHMEVGTSPSSTPLPRGEAPKGANASGSPPESAKETNGWAATPLEN